MGEALRKHRVLVVEDEDSIALALDYLMTREGYDHDRIASGSEASANGPTVTRCTPRCCATNWGSCVPAGCAAASCR